MFNVILLVAYRKFYRESSPKKIVPLALFYGSENNGIP